MEANAAKSSLERLTTYEPSSWAAMSVAPKRSRNFSRPRSEMPRMSKKSTGTVTALVVVCSVGALSCAGVAPPAEAADAVTTFSCEALEEELDVAFEASWQPSSGIATRHPANASEATTVNALRPIICHIPFRVLP